MFISESAALSCGGRYILRYCLASRILTLSLIVIWRSLLSPYDTSSSINPPCLSATATHTPDSHAPEILLPKLGAAIERSIVWDSVYFVRIAECGYEYEQAYAFFPLLPICISVLSKTVFAPLVPVIGYRAVLGFSGYVLNNILFVVSAFYLHRLSLVVTKDPKLALRASTLFCFNPASIFYSSIYSESLYAFSSFGALYYLLSGLDSRASILFAVSSFSRSNGLLNAGYICFQKLQQVNWAISLGKGAYLRILQNLLLGALCSLVIATPFISFQAYGYSSICKGGSWTEMRPWCRATLPLMYNYIQGHYWGVGFLKYFQVKQIPNFLLALPTLSLSLCSIVYYVKRWPEVFLSLGLRSSSKKKRSASSSSSIGSGNQPRPGEIPSRLNRRAIRRGCLDAQPSKYKEANKAQDYPLVIVPFVVHLAFLTATALFVMHVQVATRFLSSSPVLYWFASHVMESSSTRWKWGYVIWAYCAAYILLGTLLFSNFYPFT